MNNQFSFCRFWHVLVWTLVYHWRQLLTLFSVAVIAFATFEMFACIQARNDYAYKVSLSIAVHRCRLCFLPIASP